MHNEISTILLFSALNSLNNAVNVIIFINFNYSESGLNEVIPKVIAKYPHLNTDEINFVGHDRVVSAQ